jgi:hypothetical protein
MATRGFPARLLIALYVAVPALRGYLVWTSVHDEPWTSLVVLGYCGWLVPGGVGVDWWRVRRRSRP